MPEPSSRSPSPALFQPARNSRINVFLTFAREARAPGPLFTLPGWNPYLPQGKDETGEKHDHLARKCFRNHAIPSENIANILLACLNLSDIIMGNITEAQIARAIQR